MFQLNYLTHLSAPISVNLEVTDKCNFGCFFCFNAASSYQDMMHHSDEINKDGNKKKILIQQGENKTIQQLQKEKIFRVIDKLTESNVFQIRLFGGEFTVFKAWKEIVQYAFDRGFFISFVSNGYLFNENDVDFLVKSGVRDGVISIHGIGEGHDSITQKSGSFDRAMNTISLLKNKGINVGVSYTPNTENLKCVYDFVKILFEKYGVCDFSINRLFNDDRYRSLTLKDYYYLLEQIHKCHKEFGVNISLTDSLPRCKIPMKYWMYLSYCSQGVAFAQVDFKGNLKHCSSTSHILGNVLETDIFSLWNDELKEMRNLNHLPKSCKICPIFCGGGCTVSRGVENKFAPDEFIPEVKDEIWFSAVVKGLYNYFRKKIFEMKYSSSAVVKKSIQNKISEFPKITQRYRIRRENNGNYIVIFENTGIKILSPLAVNILKLLTGEYTVDEILNEAIKEFPRCTKLDIEEIMYDFI